MKENETYAFVYRRMSSSVETPFKLPFSYNLIWESTGLGTGKSENISVWSLNCPPDYVAVGYITTVAPKYPAEGDIYCVRRYFVELGNLDKDEGDKLTQRNVWERVWDSSRTRAHMKGLFYSQQNSTNAEHISPQSLAVVRRLVTNQWPTPLKPELARISKTKFLQAYKV